MKALIKVGYRCNENCTFCHTLDVRHVDGEAAEVERKIRRAKQLGYSMVVLSGGEPTVRPELVRWAAQIASLDMDFGLVTNGLVFSYPETFARLSAHRLKYIYMSLHGGSAKVHNAIVRSDTFDRSLAALKNLTGKGLDLTINCVVVKQNVDHLREVVDTCAPFTDAVLKFSMVQPKGGGDHLFEQLTPRVAYAGSRIAEAIAHAQKTTRLQLAHDGVPFCCLSGHEARYDDLKTHRFATMVDIGEPDFFPVDDKAKVQPPPCHGCALRGACPGLYAGYHQAFGDGELTPVTGAPRSNSFNYVYEGVQRVPEGVCPIKEDGVTPWDRNRVLFVKSKDRVVRYRTHTRDFADVELEALKHGAGQLYADMSQKDAPDDFPKDLVKLTRSALCDGCAERPHCTGLFEPLLEDVFSRDDARVRELLEQLEGDVLDVGRGEGPYDDLLARRVAAGKIRYVGLEPRPGATAPAWARLRPIRAEELDDAAAFDHVLFLRSWNHLEDPKRAVANALRALRPHGTLLVVDNIAFGLARTRAQTERAESSRAGLEHYRNDSAAEAAALLESPGLTLLERRDVGLPSSNQWILRYRAGTP
jgi:MoaA/NifB/PqqE/SkfB family radical SAM enzyme/SAM-dependent methyltransferase